MKIDVEGLLQAKGRIDSSSGPRQTIKRDAVSGTANTAQSIANTVQNISNARALIDAMVISQIAQNLMNRAIEISSKLRDIARGAIASGRVNDKELQDAISDTKTSFSKIQETFTAPVIPEKTAAAGNIQKEANIIIELPGMQKERELLAEFEAGVAGGKKPGGNDIEKIDIILNNLQNGSRLINNSYEQIAKTFGFAGNDNIDYSNLISNAAEGIVKRPEAAIISQGNVNPDNAKILLGNQAV